MLKLSIINIHLDPIIIIYVSFIAFTEIWSWCCYYFLWHFSHSTSVRHWDRNWGWKSKYINL